MDKMKEILVGVLVIIAIIMCIMFIFTFGGFEKNRNYYQVKAIFGDVNSLEVGTPVILNGEKVGDVKDIYIENDKGITQEDTKELIDTLYAFSILSYEAYTKKDTQYGEF